MNGGWSIPYYNNDEAAVYAGLWVEKRAKALGLEVRVEPSRDRDEIFRMVLFDEALAEAWVATHEDLEQQLPSIRSVEGAVKKVHSRLFHYRSIDGGVSGSKYSSLERIHILMHMLTSDADLRIAATVSPATTNGNAGHAGHGETSETSESAEADAVPLGKGAGLRLDEYEELEGEEEPQLGGHAKVRGGHHSLFIGELAPHV